LTTEWGTPQAFFDTLNAEFHFTLDVCAQPGNAKCLHYFPPPVSPHSPAHAPVMLAFAFLVPYPHVEVAVPACLLRVELPG